MSLKVTITGYKPFLKRIKELGPESKQIIDDELNAGALEMVREAKRNAPVDEGFLRNSIGADTSKILQKEFFSSAFYSVYREFGTGKKFKAPAGYESFAAKYKGKAGRGNMMQFFYRLVLWVRRKGISGTYSTKSRRRTGSRANQATQDYQVAYAIMLSILKNGSLPHPFMIPALKKVNPQIVTRIIKRIKAIK